MCSSGWYRSHRENHDFCPRKIEKSKSSHAKRFRLEKSKNSNSRKIEKFKKPESRKLFDFLIFCPGRVINPVGFWRHWCTGSVHAQGFVWLFGCSFPVECGYFPGEQETCNQRIRICVAHVVGFCIFGVDFVGSESWILKTHKIAEQVFGSGPPGGRIRDIICLNLTGNTVVLPTIKQCFDMSHAYTVQNMVVIALFYTHTTYCQKIMCILPFGDLLC